MNWNLELLKVVWWSTWLVSTISFLGWQDQCQLRGVVVSNFRASSKNYPLQQCGTFTNAWLRVNSIRWTDLSEAENVIFSLYCIPGTFHEARFKQNIVNWVAQHKIHWPCKLLSDHHVQKVRIFIEHLKYSNIDETPHSGKYYWVDNLYQNFQRQLTVSDLNRWNLPILLQGEDAHAQQFLLSTTTSKTNKRNKPETHIQTTQLWCP